MPVREHWTSRIGFIMAAVGSAVGLGNIWRFPYEAAQNGGAAFLVVNFIAIFVIGLPAILAEFVVGRRAQKNVVDAFAGVGHPAWRFVGVLGVITGFLILAYYSVVGGWVLRYFAASVTGAYFGDPSAYFSASAAGFDALFYHTLFMALTVGIVALGVRRGIELSTKLMVPSIVLMMIALVVWASTLPGSGAGYRFFLEPDVSVIVANAETIIPAAVGEVLFTLSLGMGAMITYASYVDSDENLSTDGIAIVLVNTFVGYLAGLLVFPLLFAQGVNPGEPGAGAIFVSVATAFRTLPFGEILGVIFFAVVALAALSSAISLLEVVVSFAVDNVSFSRPVVAITIGGLIFLAGIPVAFDTDVLTLYDSVTSKLLLPSGVFLITLFVGWVYGRDAVDELLHGVDSRRGRLLGLLWLWHVRIVLFAAVVMTLVLSVSEYLGISLFG
ncbi:sodium-dependent transporter [Haladaptatus caseinilyticus]|uniref:sodium-dependent transporter n=1 Tax=Haladaptatus caseinilyticus TaxID=2993314 RepID=UPI00224A7892|nr:sodium-dependent transporter [Haladaptatus caseinilyticus]